KYYRDHLNHEVLLFLLGAYIYFNCTRFRELIDEEIAKSYDRYDIPFREDALSGEFLFRWKLISTFHDIGYLFEVDAVKDTDGKEIRTKETLVAKSFGVIQRFREEFLIDYVVPYIPRGTIEEQKQEARHLIENLQVPRYPGDPIKREEDLFLLHTPEKVKDAFE